MFPLCTCRLGQLGGGEACFHGTKSYQIRLYEVDTQKLREAKGSIRLGRNQPSAPFGGDVTHQTVSRKPRWIDRDK